MGDFHHTNSTAEAEGETDSAGKVVSVSIPGFYTTVRRATLSLGWLSFPLSVDQPSV